MAKGKGQEQKEKEKKKPHPSHLSEHTRTDNSINPQTVIIDQRGQKESSALSRSLAVSQGISEYVSMHISKYIAKYRQAEHEPHPKRILIHIH